MWTALPRRSDPLRVRLHFVEVSIAPGLPALAAGQTLTAGQSLCSAKAAPTVGQGGGVTVQAPVPAPGSGPGEPGGGLGSNNNYFMYSPTASGCANLINVSVTIHVTTPMVWVSSGGPNQCPGGSGLTNGFSFQLNCYSPKGQVVAWQQYIINLWGTQLNGAINNWPLTGKIPIIFPNGEYTLNLGSSLPSTAIPAGYTLSINLGNDSSGNVNSVQWVVNGTAYPSSPHKHTNPADCEWPTGDGCSADRGIHPGAGWAGVRRKRSAFLRWGNHYVFRLPVEPSYGNECRAHPMRRVNRLYR